MGLAWGGHARLPLRGETCKETMRGYFSVYRPDHQSDPSAELCRMRIAMTIHALFGGGAERLMSQLGTWWSAAGHEVHLITWSETDTDVYPIPPSVHRLGLGLMHASRGQWSGLWANFHRVHTLRAALKAIQPDFILSFCDQMNIVTLQAAVGARHRYP